MRQNDSIFDIPSASSLYCRFSGLRRSLLKIALYDVHNVCKYTVNFSSVAYMRCPSQWKGAQFREANVSERNQFLALVPDETKEKWRVKNLDPTKHYYDFYKIYVIHTHEGTKPSLPIVFVAEDAYVNEEDNQ